MSSSCSLIHAGMLKKNRVLLILMLPAADSATLLLADLPFLSFFIFSLFVETVAILVILLPDSIVDVVDDRQICEMR